ncbi:MAG: iron chelate uptake ABC transporter family permease subunit [Methanomassiliicoccaceae archaeon]|nr:iron chelate uptake ABC transporter family permease subunit [Methanomassiliicoccaceae archaeon]
MRKAFLTLLVVTSALLAPLSMVYASDESSAASDRYVLIDFGNGQTEWVEADASQDTISGLLGTAVGGIGGTYDDAGADIIVNGISARSSPVTVSWRYFVWTDAGWEDGTASFDGNAASPTTSVALAYYPGGTAPVETPSNRSSWTCIRGSSESEGHQDADLSGENVAGWTQSYGEGNFVNSAVLVAGDRVFVNAGGTSNMGTTSGAPQKPTLYCYDRTTGEEQWSYEYDVGAGYETATGVIVGDFIYVPATNGHIYKIPLSGPNEGGSNVTVSGDGVFGSVRDGTDSPLEGIIWATGPASIVYYSGALYFGTAAGYIFCTDLDLNVLWKGTVDGTVYFNAPTVQDGRLFIGALDGSMYVFDAFSGDAICNESVYSVEAYGKMCGFVSNILQVEDRLIFSFNDGKGMNATSGGYAVYKFDGTSLSKISKVTELGLSSSYMIKSDSSFSGAYSFTSDGLVKIYLDGSYELINGNIRNVRAPGILVNDEYIVASEYDRKGHMYIIGTDGSLLGQYEQPESVAEYVMSPPVIVDNWIYSGTDGGVYSFSGGFLPIPSAVQQEKNIILWAVSVLVAILAAFLAYCVYVRKKLDVPPIPYIRGKISEKLGSNSESRSKIKRNKKRLFWVLVLGTVASAVMFLLCLAFGPSGNYSMSETFSLLGSAISKGGHGLTGDETIIFDSRLPRALAAFAVGIGLSMAGAVYQAIIRNPLVDPYIMGVSAGAGTFAVATISAGFTFFGVFSTVTYSLPLMAMAGGLIAFGATMIIAEKAGGSSTNYVLAGVIVGLGFGAVQTLLLYSAGDKIHSAMTWLFGSFTSIDWGNIWLVLIPAILLALVPLIWAKEFNLVLLGEDQAQEMGLDVRKFNRAMLILASVLTAVCVAFVGTIGFVGLVVPHLCRMILGGDHRLVMPSSIVLGGLLMMAADFVAKMLIAPIELPVGAITTIIGAPVFVYLIMKKGRMYGD